MNRSPPLLTSLAFLLVVAAPATARSAGWEAAPPSGRIMVNVRKTGLFSGFAHDHHFEVTEWRAKAEVPDGDPGHGSVDVVLSSGSLHDREKALSEGDRRKVDAQTAGPEVLDAAHHPEVEYRAEGVALDPAGAEGGAHARGTLHGTLTLHGRSRPVDVPIEVERSRDAWRVQGRARLKQSDFGIRPIRIYGGTVGVKDEVEIEIDLTLHPAGEGAR